MTAVARLVLVYFTGTTLRFSLSVAGAAAILAGTVAMAFLPPLTAQHGLPSRFSLAEEALLMLLPIAGITALLFGGSLMPALVLKLSTSRHASVLPHARGKLLASAIVTVALVALVAACASLAYEGLGIPLPVVFQRTLATGFATYTLLYVVLGIASRGRSALVIIGGALLVIATMLLPLRFLNPATPLRWATIPAVALWAAIAAALLFAPRLNAWAIKLRVLLASTGSSRYSGREEVELMVGTGRPWLLALGQILPAVAAVYLLSQLYGNVAVDIKAKVWLFYLTLVSVLVSATASTAAARSRALWLRAHWTRPELFARIEAAFWKRNCYTLGVLILTMVIAGTQFALPTRALAFGVALLALSTALSTYLGLMITRTLGWKETALAVAGVLLLLATSVYATDRSATLVTVAMLELALAVSAAFLRELAHRRWSNLDWMLCRPDSTTRATA